MTVSSPEYLDDNSSGTSSWGSAYRYKLRSQDSDWVYYDLWDTTVTPENWYSGTLSTGGWKIKVGIDSSDSTTYDQWFDEGTNQPTSVVENGVNVELYTNSTLSYQFLKPTTADWINGITGSLTKVVTNGQTYITYVIDATSPSSSTGTGLYNIKAATTNNNINVDVFSGGIPHTTGTVTTSTFAPHVTGTFELYNTGTSMNSFAETSMGTVVATLVSTSQSTSTTRRKVHSNFW